MSSSRYGCGVFVSVVSRKAESKMEQLECFKGEWPPSPVSSAQLRPVVDPQTVLNLLNSAVYGAAFRRHGKRLRVLPVLEKGEIRSRALEQLGVAFERVGLETGSTAAWLYNGLRDRGLSAVCIAPRRLRAVTLESFRLCRCFWKSR
jgi:hypothetical protein